MYERVEIGQSILPTYLISLENEIKVSSMGVPDNMPLATLNIIDSVTLIRNALDLDTSI